MSASLRTTRLIGLVATLALVIGLLGIAPAALANHGTLTLNVEPETASRTQGEEHTMTATLSATVVECPAPATGGYGGCGPVNIDFENESGPNDPDASNSYTSPDLTCTVAVGSNSCVVSYFGNRTGTDQWRDFIDHDNNNATVEADLEEQRNENPEQDPTDPSDDDPLAPGGGCRNNPTPGEPTPRPVFNPAAEPDCTDVVEATFRAPASTPTTLDCDDQSGDDREVNALGDPETYTCTVRDQNGNGMRNQLVLGENENGVNDGDIVDGPSYNSPEYQCRTATPANAPFVTPTCTIMVSSVENEEGTAQICFWVDSDGNTSTDEGTALCQTLGEDVDEPEANDLADRVLKRWVRASRPSRLNCEPETDSNPVGTSHTITCTVQNQGNDTTPRQNQGGIQVDVEATGANDPDASNTPETPDFTCTTAGDQDSTTPPAQNEGVCTFTHGPGGKGTTNETGQTLYRAGVDYDKDDTTRPAEFTDDQEGRNEAQQPGTHPEVDETDVVEKNWILAPKSLSMTPESDSAPVGTCNAFTITALDEQNRPVEGAIIDVEQRHERSTNSTANDEPTVAFCEPSAEDGPNPSMVDETRGDLRPPEEDPDNKGTAGGETVKGTDAQGKITFGITVTGGNNSDGSGTVEVTAFFDVQDAQGRENDDPDAGEAQDKSTKTWVPAPQGRTIDCQPKTDSNPVGTDHLITCTVRDSAARPVQGEGVTFTETGPGEFVGSAQDTTDANGQATATVRSETESGTQSITGTLTDDTQGSEPGEVDECDRAANDPSNSPAGKCSDTVSKTWTGGQAPECSDGADNDNDGATDHPADPDCESPEDDSELREAQTRDEASNISIRYRQSRNRFRGSVGSADQECQSGRRVTVKKVRQGRDRVIGRTVTTSFGNWSLRKSVDRGRYYANVAKKTFVASNGDTVNCLFDRSPRIRIRG
jgi:hypothetical protein